MSKEKETGKEKRRIRQLARYYIPYKLSLIHISEPTRP